MVITAQDDKEFQFLTDLLKKLNIANATITEEEIEDLGLSKMMKSIDKTKKVTKESIIKKLQS